MAELNTGDGGGKKGGGKVRSKKANPSVDLTAMVDLAFLLITFFILTTTLSKPQSMNLAMPDDIKDQAPPPETPAWRTLTLVLGSNDKLVWYSGRTDGPPLDGPVATGYGKTGVRDLILNKKAAVDAKNKAEGADIEKSGITIIIKPSKKSNYKNLVDILDEMAITKVKKYAIVDITDADIKFLEDNKIY
ncbi:biopolymer transporter ExbD [uncultured Flavobacterium sp.]|uniref:ExbD/TolR family protein n=1 Tax=uncultured Flavobacterium sp. TaxID=165435 RepID=UPI00122AA884|nr:biopolymer transporter ExbD [uncultured Flavobacterium sp.]THD33391.1 MAG: biopolymer transporter ExbD [Flavobacterium johnsoniae]